MQYSYGDGVVYSVSRMESALGDIVRLVLPEDSEVKKVRNPPSAAVQPVQRLTIRILEGYFGAAHKGSSTQVLLLEVRVDGLATKLKSWTLNLERGGKPWKAAYQKPILLGKPIKYLPGAEGLMNAKTYFQLIPGSGLDPLVPSRGWLYFTVENCDANFPDLLFGATFVLAAIEEGDYKSTYTELAGEWLHRAEIEVD